MTTCVLRLVTPAFSAFLPLNSPLTPVLALKPVRKCAWAVLAFSILASPAFAFEGRINAAFVQGARTNIFRYTVGPDDVRIEIVSNNWPNPVDIVERQSGAMTLLFPQNRSFVRLKPAAENPSAPPGFPAMPAMPPGVGAQTQSPPSPPKNIGPTNLPGMPEMPAPPQMPAMPNMPAGGGMPAMPMMRPPMMPGMTEKMELQDTGQKTNLLGFTCEQYEIKQRGEVMEIWATDQLFPFQSYQQNQPHRFGPQMMEKQWGELLKAKKLFPLLAVLRFETPSLPGQAVPAPAGPERMRFEVQSVTPERITDNSLFQPPPDYQEIQPLPF